MENFDDKYKKKNPFGVPDAYFDGLTDRIIGRVEQHEKLNRSSFRRRIKPYMGWAALFFLALFVVQVLLPEARKGEGQEKDTVVQMKDLEGEDIFDSQFNPTTEEIIEYLASEVDNYELIYAGIY